MYELLEQSDMLVSQVSLRFRRYLAAHINWHARLIGIKGGRGTGKTTMLLQWLYDLGRPAREAAYFTLDDLFFSANTLVDTAKQFYKQGGQILVLDEVHKYPGWSREIKNLYDLYPDLQIVFTGSSVIDIVRQEGDLSRRVQMYELPGLSFREYLQLTGVLDVKAVKLDDITGYNQSWRSGFPKGFKPLKYFEDYLRFGYYPFFYEEQEGYHKQLNQLVRTIIEYDMAELKGFDIRNAKKMLQLVYLIAQNVPFKPNLSKLAQKSGIHRNSMMNYLHFLAQAHLIGLLYASGISIATLQKPEKIFLDNTNLLYALAQQSPSKGTVRETFFYNQLCVQHQVNNPRDGDFQVDHQYTFEIGGKDKTSSQIEGIPDAWVVRDDLTFPAGNALPLWLFGFLY